MIIMGFFRDDDDEYTGKTGDPFRDAVYGWDMGFDSSSSDYDDKQRDYGNSKDTSNASKKDSYSKKAWDYYMDFKEEEALHYIDLALDLDKSDSNNWDKKAIILEGMKRYSESEYCYDISLNLSFNNVVCDNKVRMLYDWASQLIEESEKSANALKKLEEAKEKNFKAINARPGENSEENIDKYLSQRDMINIYIGCEKEYRRNLSTLNLFSKDELFTIAGKQYYNIDLASGMDLRLVKEPDNEHDSDAIAVYVKDEKVGYVANSYNTKHELTSSASELQDKIQNNAEGIYLLSLNRFLDMPIHIGRIIK